MCPIEKDERTSKTTNATAADASFAGDSYKGDNDAIAETVRVCCAGNRNNMGQVHAMKGSVAAAVVVAATPSSNSTKSITRD